MSRPVAPMKWWQWAVLPLLLGIAAAVGVIFARLAVPFDREPSLALQVSCAAVAVAAGLAVIFWLRRLRSGQVRTLRYRVLPVGFALIAALHLRDMIVARTADARWWAAIGVGIGLAGVVALLLEARKKGREAA